MAEAKARRMKDAKPVAVPVKRDTTFARAVADRVIPIYLGRDVELACLQIGPNLTGVQDFEDRIRLDQEPALTEVVRLRLSWPSALDLALQIIQTGVSNNRLKSEWAVETIQAWIDDEKSGQNDMSESDAAD